MRDTQSLIVADVHQGPQEIVTAPAGVLICDIDGTIADIGHRLEFIQQEPKDWNRFFAACAGDAPIFEIIMVVQALARAGWTVLYCTGRRSDEHDETLDWMRRYGLPEGTLMMRRSGDRRPDVQVKRDMLTDMYAVGMVPDLVLEDRARVVEMWRKAGLRVVQVREGDY